MGSCTGFRVYSFEAQISRGLYELRGFRGIYGCREAISTLCLESLSRTYQFQGLVRVLLEVLTAMK